MKLQAYQLEPHLAAKKLFPIYIVGGEDILLKQDAIHAIKQAAQQQGFSECVRLTMETGKENELYQLLHSASLFAEKRLVELNLMEMTPNKTIDHVLQEYAKKPASENLLLIMLGKIDPKIAKSSWYVALEKISVVVTVWPIPREKLPQWLQQRAKKLKLQLEVAAAQLLTDYTEGNLLAAAQALEKISLLQPNKIIDVELIQTLLTDESHFTIFDFVDAMIAGQSARAIHMLEQLRLDSIEPVLILWGITRELRLLNDMAQQLKQGHTYQAIFQKQKVFPKKQAGVRQFLATFTSEDCWRALAHAAHIDQIIKGARVENVWDAMQLFCLRFCR